MAIAEIIFGLTFLIGMITEVAIPKLKEYSCLNKQAYKVYLKDYTLVKIDSRESSRFKRACEFELIRKRGK